MVLLEDSRNQIGKHDNIHRYCEENGITIQRSKLYVGDYQLANDGSIVVDTKQDVIEIAGNVYHDHGRFVRECLRAKEANIRLIILVEEALPMGRLDLWRPPVYKHKTKLHEAGEPMRKINPISLRKTLLTMEEKYGVMFRFCDPADTGERIMQYLTT